MSHPGVGVMIHQLSGGSEQSADKYYGRKIKSAEFKDDKVKLKFDDGVSISIYDDGQSCCESRYMTTDDKIESIVGQTLRGITVKSHEDKESDGEHHEVCFLEISTDKDAFVFATHVEHNGYYGGFGLTIVEDTPK